ATFPIDQVRGTVETVDNSQPFPVYGFLDVKWQRQDTIPPVVRPPASATIAATEPGGARWYASPALTSFIFGATAVDSVDPAPVLLWPQVSGVDVTPALLLPIGTTPVTFRARDYSGNIGTAQANVTVITGAPRLAIVTDAAQRVTSTRTLAELRLV